jgi:hypothetical protein
MPRRNGTGPEGAGPLTGRGLGYCRSGSGDYASRGFFKRGYRRGYCRWDLYDRYSISPEEELQFLKDEKDVLIKRVEELEKLIEKNEK